MVLTNEQIRELLDIIRNHHSSFVYKNITREIDPKQVQELVDKGYIKPSEEVGSYFKDAYEITRLKELIESSKFKNMNYDQFRRFLFQNPIPMTDTEALSINHVQQSAGQYITKQGDLLRHGFEENIRNKNVDLKNEVLSQTVRTPLQAGIEQRKLVTEIVSEMREASDDQFRDWHRVAQTELQNARNLAAVDNIYATNKNKPDTEILVYKRPNPDACRVCKSVYLERDGVTPKVFTMSEFKKNLTNFGLKTKKWMPTIETVHPWSVADKRTRIYTSTGWKQIQHIKLGDMVLTASGKFSPVVSVLKHHPNHNKILYEIYFKYGRSNKNPDNINKLTLTPDHKLLTQRGWIRTDNLSKKDKLIKVIRRCKVCNKKIDIQLKDDITCSKKCMYSLPKNLMGIHGENKKEVYNKISDTIKKHWKNGQYSNTLKNLKSSKMIENSKSRMLNGGAIKAMKCSIAPSKPQLKLFNMIQKRFPTAKLEYEIFNKSLDIAIPELKIDIEYDGKYWHNNRKKEDNERDKLLEKNGWHVLRYSNLPKQKDLNKDIIRLSQNTNNEYEFEELDIEWIKRFYALPSSKLYDITVDGEENNFIAKGIVIHNCQCEMATLPPGFGFDKNGHPTFKGKDYNHKSAKPQPAESNWNIYDSSGNLKKSEVIKKIKKSKYAKVLKKSLESTGKHKFSLNEVMNHLKEIKRCGH